MLQVIGDTLVVLENDMESREKAARLLQLSLQILRKRFEFFWRDCGGRDLVPHLVQAERALDAAQRFFGFLSWIGRFSVIRYHFHRSGPFSAAVVYHVTMLVRNLSSDVLTLLDLKVMPDPMLPEDVSFLEQDDILSPTADEHPHVKRTLATCGRSRSLPLISSEWSARRIETGRTYRPWSLKVLTLPDALKMLLRPLWRKQMQKGLDIISLNTVCEVVETAAQFVAITLRVLGLAALPSHRGPSPCASLVQGIAEFVHACGRAFGGERFPDALAQWLIFVAGLCNLNRRAVELRAEVK
mmetsp:Transcript_122579/g.236326  ORF Transcript_122579/g.236326 Transcript_122579/m.236326 type:complete len:299 (-) Transcript_122579:25-921(-)